MSFLPPHTDGPPLVLPPPGRAGLIALKQWEAVRQQEEQLRRAREEADEVRDKCRTFRGFVEEAWPQLEPGRTFVPNWHIDAICEHLEAITWGRMEPRLGINVPPGSMKSLLVSVLWQAWEWGPCGLRTNRFLSTSFEIGNVTRDTRKTRDLIAGEWFQALWPECALKRAGETSFENFHTGTREGVAFTSITAKRGDRFTIDDPHSIDGAESETERDKATLRFIEGGQNRLNDQVKSAIVIIMQRLHERDLTGVVQALPELGFTFLMIPMEFEPKRRFVTPIGWTDPRTNEGELMDPRRMPERALIPLRVSEYSYAGQYQQRPAPREGGLFKVEKIEIIKASEPGGSVARGWDLAGTKKKKSPFSASVKIRRVPGKVIIEHADRFRGNPNDVKERIKLLAGTDGLGVLQSLPQDPGQAGVAQKFDLADELQDIEGGANYTFSPESGEKEFRARPLAAAVGAGIVQMVDGPGTRLLLEEMRNFPNGEYKDLVDAASRAYSELVGKAKPDTLAGPELVEVGDTPSPSLEAVAADPWL